MIINLHKQSSGYLMARIQSQIKWNFSESLQLREGLRHFLEMIPKIMIPSDFLCFGKTQNKNFFTNNDVGEQPQKPKRKKHYTK